MVLTLSNMAMASFSSLCSTNWLSWAACLRCDRLVAEVVWDCSSTVNLSSSREVR